MKHLLVLIISTLCFVACTNKPADHVQQSSLEWSHYSCAWFDFDYPPYFQVEEVRNAISDTIPAAKDGGEVILYDEICPFRLRFVKSAMFDVFDTPEEWRDLSIQLKEYDNQDDYLIYLGVYATEDSLNFQGHPAASVYYAALADSDTLVQYQLVIMNQSTKDLYYLNYLAPYSLFDDYRDTADSIMNTIKLR